MDDLMATPACALPTVERPARLAELDALFSFATSVDYDGRTARMHLSGPATLHDHVLDLTDRESRCCSFFGFAVTGDGAEVDLEITAPIEHEAIVAALVARADEVAR